MRQTRSMSDYTIKNLKEIEDSAERFGLAPNIEARFGRDALEAESGGVSYQRLAPDFRQPFGHRHEQQEEVYVLVGGSARVKLEDEVQELTPWDALRVAPGTMRCFEGGPKGAEIIVFGAGSRDQTEMIPGWWTD